MSQPASYTWQEEGTAGELLDPTEHSPRMPLEQEGGVLQPPGSPKLLQVVREWLSGPSVPVREGNWPRESRTRQDPADITRKDLAVICMDQSEGQTGPHVSAAARGPALMPMHPTHAQDR